MSPLREKAFGSLLVMALAVAAFPVVATAACSSPAAEAGARKYFTGDHKFKLCDGTNWIDFETDGTMGACSVNGRVDYDNAAKAYKYCGNSVWQKIGRAPCALNTMSYVTRTSTHSRLDRISEMKFSDDGTKLYVVAEYQNRIRVYDVSSPPAAPTYLGESAAVAGMLGLFDVHVRGNYLYTASEESEYMYVFSLSNPTTPVLSGSATAPSKMMFRPRRMAVSDDGRHVFVSSWASGTDENRCYMNVFNVETPASPTRVSSFDVTTAASVGYYCNGLVIRHNRAYLAVDNTIVILDVSNPSSLSYLGKTSAVPRLTTSQDLVLSEDGNHLFFPSLSYTWFNVVNVSNPASPSVVGGFQDAVYFTDAGRIARVGRDRVLVTSNGNDRLASIDVSNPTSPTMLISVFDHTNMDGAQPIAVRGRYAYVGAQTAQSLAVIDLGCDGQESGGTPSQGGCGGPPAMQYQSGNKSLVYCDGTDLRIMSKGAISCPANYVPVPAMPPLTTADFCVAKYEMKNVGSVATSQAAGLPWLNINRNNSRTRCSSLGTGYRLISNAQWQTIARNIAGVGWNWSSGFVGIGSINRGHSDSNPAVALAASANDNDACVGTGQSCSSTVWHMQRRTNRLSNGQTIWDVGGNVFEWVYEDYTDLGVSPAIAGSWQDFSALTAANRLLFGPADANWTWYQGIGRIYGGSGGGVLRGGDFNFDIHRGIFATYLSNIPTVADDYTSFRCVYTPP